jgi:hypothetical protein
MTPVHAAGHNHNAMKADMGVNIAEIRIGARVERYRHINLLASH